MRQFKIYGNELRGVDCMCNYCPPLSWWHFKARRFWTAPELRAVRTQGWRKLSLLHDIEIVLIHIEFPIWPPDGDSDRLSDVTFASLDSYYDIWARKTRKYDSFWAGNSEYATKCSTFRGKLVNEEGKQARSRGGHRLPSNSPLWSPQFTYSYSGPKKWQ